MLEYKMSSTLCPLLDCKMNTSGTWALTDRTNTTTTDSARALDFSTQYQSSVVYEKNLEDMYNNAVSELKDIQFKSRERSPYNTNLCTLKPMYPTWNAAQPCFPPSCGLNMHPVCQGGTACNPPNTFFAGGSPMSSLDPYSQIPLSQALLATPQIQALEEAIAFPCESDEETEDGEEDLFVVGQNRNEKIKPFKRMRRNMMRALMGVAYDINHWNQLPPQKNRLSTGKTFKYVLGRDNRPLYIVMLVAFFVFIISILVGITCLVNKSRHRSKRNRVIKDLREQAYLQYQLQNLQSLSRPPYYGAATAPSAPPYPGLTGGIRKW